MNFVRFLLPLTFVTLLSAAPEKPQKQIVAKATVWKSWKAEAAGLTVEKFIEQRKNKQPQVALAVVFAQK